MNHAHDPHQPRQPPVQNIQLFMPHPRNHAYQIDLHAQRQHERNHRHRNHPGPASKRRGAQVWPHGIIRVLRKDVQHWIHESCHNQSPHADRNGWNPVPALVCERAEMRRSTIIRASSWNNLPWFLPVAAAVADGDLKPPCVEPVVVDIQNPVNDNHAHKQEHPAHRMRGTSPPWP